MRPPLNPLFIDQSEQLAALRLQYPHQLPYVDSRYLWPRGWMCLVRDACAQLHAHDPTAYWQTICIWRNQLFAKPARGGLPFARWPQLKRRAPHPLPDCRDRADLRYRRTLGHLANLSAETCANCGASSRTTEISGFRYSLCTPCWRGLRTGAADTEIEAKSGAECHEA